MNKFEIGDKIRIIASETRLTELGLCGLSLANEAGYITRVRQPDYSDDYGYDVTITTSDDNWAFRERDLELVEQKQPTTFVGHSDGELVAVDDPSTIRTFATGATRDTTQGKLDYVKALSPIVLRRYVQYLDEHRLQSDGLYRDFDNWKKGIPQETYHSSAGRHFMATWLLTEGYTAEDNHGPVKIEDALCGLMFNTMGRLHEILKEKAGRTVPVEGEY